MSGGGGPATDTKKLWTYYTADLHDLGIAKEQSLASTRAKLGSQGLRPGMEYWEKQINKIETQYSTDVADISGGISAKTLAQMFSIRENGQPNNLLKQLAPQLRKDVPEAFVDVSGASSEDPIAPMFKPNYVDLIFNRYSSEVGELETFLGRKPEPWELFASLKYGLEDAKQESIFVKTPAQEAQLRAQEAAGGRRAAAAVEEKAATSTVSPWL